MFFLSLVPAAPSLVDRSASLKGVSHEDYGKYYCRKFDTRG